MNERPILHSVYVISEASLSSYYTKAMYIMPVILSVMSVD